MLKGHKNAILDLCWSSTNEKLYTGASDKQIFLWDTMSAFQRTRKFKGHTNVVNSIDVLNKASSVSSSDIVASGSDDMTVKLWDERVKRFIASYELDYQVTAVAFSRGHSNASDYIYFGGLDNTIKALNLRKNAIEFALIGHTDTVTGVSVSNDGKSLVSNAMDNTVKVWDIRAFVSNANKDQQDNNRCL